MQLLKLSVVHIGVLAFLSDAAGSFTKAFAVTNWFMYLAVGLSALRAMAHPMCRTIASNVLPPNELGKGGVNFSNDFFLFRSDYDVK